MTLLVMGKVQQQRLDVGIVTNTTQQGTTHTRKDKKSVFFSVWRGIGTTHWPNHAILLTRDDSCMSCTPSASNHLVPSANHSYRKGFWKSA